MKQLFYVTFLLFTLGAVYTKKVELPKAFNEELYKPSFPTADSAKFLMHENIPSVMQPPLSEKSTTKRKDSAEKLPRWVAPVAGASITSTFLAGTCYAVWRDKRSRNTPGNIVHLEDGTGPLLENTLGPQGVSVLPSYAELMEQDERNLQQEASYEQVMQLEQNEIS